MPLASLDRGEKVDIHVLLYAADVKTLDALCKRYGASRAAVLGELLREQQAREASAVPAPPQKG